MGYLSLRVYFTERRSMCVSVCECGDECVAVIGSECACGQGGQHGDLVTQDRQKQLFSSYRVFSETWGHHCQVLRPSGKSHFRLLHPIFVCVCERVWERERERESTLWPPLLRTGNSKGWLHSLKLRLCFCLQNCAEKLLQLLFSLKPTKPETQNQNMRAWAKSDQ